MSSTGGPCRRACSATADRGAERASPGTSGRSAPAGRSRPTPTSAGRERWLIEILTLDASATASGSSGALPNAAPPGCARGAGRIHPRPAAACASRAARRGTGQAAPATRGSGPRASRGGTRRGRARTSVNATAGRPPGATPPASAFAAARRRPRPRAPPARAAPQRGARPNAYATRRPWPPVSSTLAETPAPSGGAPAPPAGSASTNVVMAASARGAAAGRPSRAARPAGLAARRDGRPSANSTPPGAPTACAFAAAPGPRTAVPGARPVR